ncbi:hypothetical protein Bbelb_012210 [Branchiostoma belcheri]|nr:hypothetical protein Bbelb_012210 [Branchiostoma belcheri]
MNNPTNLIVIVILIARGYTRKLRYEEESNFTEFDEAPYYFIFKNYDNRLRPNFAGTPVTVGIAIDVSSIDSISDQDMMQQRVNPSASVDVNSELIAKVTKMSSELMQKSQGSLAESPRIYQLTSAWKDGQFVTVTRSDNRPWPDGDYTMTMDLSQSWHDERLSFSGDVESYDLADDYLSKVWVPDTYFVNGKQSYFHEVTVKNRAMKIFSNGMIEYNLRLTTVASCMMNMMNYPMDVQNCSLVLESYSPYRIMCPIYDIMIPRGVCTPNRRITYCGLATRHLHHGYTLKDIRLYWRHGRESITGLAGIQLPTFAIVDFQTSSGASQLDTGAFPRVVLNFQLHRDVGQVIFLIYVPCMLLVSLSWVAFWIDYKVVVGRVVLGMETFLALLTFITGVRKGLPKVAYIHTVDIYHLVCMVFVCATLIQYAVVNFKYYRPKKKGSKSRWQSAMSRRGKQRCNKDHHVDKAGIIQLLKMSSLMLNRKLAKNVKHSFAKIRRSHTAPCLSSFIRDQATSTKQALDLQLKKSPTGPLYFTDGESVESNNVLGTDGTHRDSRLLTNRHPCGSISGSEPRMLLRRRWRRRRTDSENTSDEEVKQKSSSSSTSFKLDTASNSPNIQRHNRVYRHRSNSDTATEGGKQRYEGTLTPTFARFTSDGDIQAFPPSSDKREGEQHGYREKSRHHTQNGTAHNLLVEWENEAVRTTYIHTQKRHRKVNAIDYHCRFIFPLLFATFNLVYWLRISTS